MAKKIVLGFLLIFIAYNAQSQILISIIFGDKLNSDGMEFGLDAGFNMSQITGLESKTYATDLHLGFYFDIRMKNQLWLKTGVLVKSSQGHNKLTKNDVIAFYPEFSSYVDSGTFSQSMGYFNIPIMLKYKFKNHFFIEGGPQLGYLTSARLNYEHEYEDITLTSSWKNKDSFNRIDFGLVGGVGYKLRKGTGINIAVKYYYGLVDITPSTSVANYNNVIYFKVDIPIGREKAKAKADAKANSQ